MIYLLDTSAVIRFDRRFDDHFTTDDSFTVSAVTVGELSYGIDTVRGDEHALRQIRLDDVIRHFEVIPFGVEEAKLYGVLAQLLRAAGRNPHPRRLDLQIAATAAASRLPLVTANPRDFAGLGRMVDVMGV